MPEKPKLIKVSKKNTKMTAQGLMVKVNDELYILLEAAPKKPETEQKPKVKIPVQTPEEKAKTEVAMKALANAFVEAGEKEQEPFRITKALWGFLNEELKDGTFAQYMDVTQKLQESVKGGKLKIKATEVALGSFVRREGIKFATKKSCQVTYKGGGLPRTVMYDEGNEIELPLKDDDKKWTEEEKSKAADAVKKLAEDKLSEKAKAEKAVADMVKNKKDEPQPEISKEVQSDIKIIALLAEKDPNNHKPAFYAVPRIGRPIDHGPFQSWAIAKDHARAGGTLSDIDTNYYQVMNMGSREIIVSTLSREGIKVNVFKFHYFNDELNEVP